jgi:hypothetical protein
VDRDGREALDHGVSVGRLKARDLDRPFHGIRTTTRPLVLLDDRCRAFLLRMPVGGVYSHVTAATLYSILAGLPQPAVNVEVFDSRGRFIARVDLCYPHLKLSLEYQGDQHRTDRA